MPSTPISIGGRYVPKCDVCGDKGWYPADVCECCGMDFKEKYCDCAAGDTLNLRETDVLKPKTKETDD